MDAFGLKYISDRDPDRILRVLFDTGTTVEIIYGIKSLGMKDYPQVSTVHNGVWEDFLNHNLRQPSAYYRNAGGRSNSDRIVLWGQNVKWYLR